MKDRNGYNLVKEVNAWLAAFVSVLADDTYHMVTVPSDQYGVSLKGFTWYVSVNFHF